MNAAKVPYCDIRYATQHRQRKLFKIRELLFGCRKDGPRESQSDCSLECTSRSSVVVDVSPSRSTLHRLPAGNSPCYCTSSDSTQTNTTREMFTQTYDNEANSKIKQSGHTPRQSVTTQDGTRQDGATQTSISQQPNNPTGPMIQVEYKNISRRFDPLNNIVMDEYEPYADTTSLSENFKRRYIAIDPTLCGLSVEKDVKGKKGKMPMGPVPPAKVDHGTQYEESPEKDSDSKEQLSPRRSDSPGSKSPEPEKKGGTDARQPQSKQPVPQKRAGSPAQKSQGPVRKAGNQPPQSKSPESENNVGRDSRQPQSKQPSSQPSNQPPAKGPGNAVPNRQEPEKKHMKEIMNSQEEESAEGKMVARIPEILGRVCELESKMTNQECALKKLQCILNISDSEEDEPCCCSPQPQCDDNFSEGCPSSKEFLDIFCKPDPKPKVCCSATSQNEMCPSNEQGNSKKMYVQCCKNSNNLLQQFNQMFVKPRGQESSCKKKKADNDITITLEQCPIEPQKEKGCKKKKPEKESCGNSKAEETIPVCLPIDSKPKNCNKRKASSTSCSAKNNAPKPCKSMQKEIYESVLNQFVNYFTNPTTNCGDKPPCQKDEGEKYSFERMCAELANLFTKSKAADSSSAVMEEDKPKRVSISCSKTVMGEDQKADCQESTDERECNSISDKQNEKPCVAKKNLSNCAEPPVPTGGCQSCCNNVNPPVLDSLVGKLMNLIGCRPFRDVVLTILRRGCNIYHLNVIEMATGNGLGCLLANGTAINEAIDLGLFEDIHTFCELNKSKANDPRGCPLNTNSEAVIPLREPGGETHLIGRDKGKGSEFFTRVLDLPAGEAGRFFSLTNALKFAKNSSDQSLLGSELSGASENPSLIGRGAVTGNLIFLGSAHDVPVTTDSLSDLSELGEASKHFLRLLSGRDHEEDHGKAKSE